MGRVNPNFIAQAEETILEAFLSSKVGPNTSSISWIPKAKAFCRIAPAARFMAFEILATGVLLLECASRSRTCSLVQATRFVRVLVLFGLVVAPA